MIGWMCGFTRLDGIRNGVIRSLAEVAPIEEKLRETRLRWFGHVKRRKRGRPSAEMRDDRPPPVEREGGVDRKRV